MRGGGEVFGVSVEVVLPAVFDPDAGDGGGGVVAR